MSASITETVSSPQFATQTRRPFALTASPPGRLPTGTEATTAPAAVSMIVTMLDAREVT